MNLTSRVTPILLAALASVALLSLATNGFAQETVRIIKQTKKKTAPAKSNNQDSRKRVVKKKKTQRRVVRRYVTTQHLVQPVVYPDRLYYSAAPRRAAVRRGETVVVQPVIVQPVVVGDRVTTQPVLVQQVPVGAAPEYAEETTGGFFAPTQILTYAQFNLGYSGLRGDGDENKTVFNGLDYSLMVGWGIDFARVEGSFEGTNQWYNEKSSGFPSDLNIYSGNIDLKLVLPLWYIEPYVYFGVGAAVYHPNPELVSSDVDLWDWGSASRVGVGVQVRFLNFAVGVDYNHRWYNFGGETETLEDLKMQLSAYRGHFTYYF